MLKSGIKKQSLHGTTARAFSNTVRELYGSENATKQQAKAVSQLESNVKRSSNTVALFATCLVDFMRPSVGFAAASLIKNAGYNVDVPTAQTCCGQPQYNGGDAEGAKALARHTIKILETYAYIVVPSGSCAGMLSKHYPRLLAGDKDWGLRARSLANRVFELTAFLVDVAQVKHLDEAVHSKATSRVVALHDSCSCLREIRSESQPRALLNMAPGLTIKNLPGRRECCGFGGTFCVKYSEISTHMVDAKIKDIEATRADTITSADLGCLMNIAGRLHRLAKPQKVWHIAELLTRLDEQVAPICPTDIHSANARTP